VRTLLVLAALLAAAPARAQAPASVAATAPAPTETAAQRQAREIREYGGSHRLVGNKAESRFPTHSYVAFTFDDGPSPATTPKVMDALDEYDVPATFFIVGNRLAGDKPDARKNRATLQEQVRRGFHIGNHTLHHLNLKKASRELLATEIETSADLIEKVAGYRPYLVRFPYGIMAATPRAYLAEHRYTEVGWNIDSEDFKVSDRKKLRESTIQQIVDWNGGVVLFHDVKTWTAEEIGHVFDDLEAINCARLKTREPLLLPVSLHYFARDEKGKPRPIPAEVDARTRRYVENLPGRCKARIDKRRASK